MRKRWRKRHTAPPPERGNGAWLRWRDHREIREELDSHYEDYVKDLERLGYAPELAAEWYSFRLTHLEGDGRGVLHADIPVRVMLYDETGDLLDTLELTVDNYEIMER